MINIPEQKQLILFDGICNLCNDVVLKLIKIDKNNTEKYRIAWNKFNNKQAEIDLIKMYQSYLY